jgi:hypothetical protein
MKDFCIENEAQANDIENIFNKIMAVIFPNLGKDSLEAP